jgi:TonB-linked SusC/RagA family outer membrane protein
MNNIRKTFAVAILVTAVQVISAQTVSGLVSDAEANEPLAGVTIMLAGSSTATMTDVDGGYTINVPQNGKLTFSFVGYTPQTINVNGRKIINVALKEEATELNEVVAIGYGTMKKSDLTGAIGSVSGDKLKSSPVSGIDKALQGQLAGVTVNSNSGQPGSDAIVRVRGIGTVNKESPIYVIDGVITDNIAFLNPSDITRIDVLKDASSTSIYGSRGANGVIIITTKQGEKGDGKISFNSYIGFQNRWRKLDLMKRDEMAVMENRLSTSAGEKTVFFNDGFDAWLKAYKIGSSYYPAFGTYNYANTETDWQDAVFNPNATIKNYYLSFSGGTEKSNYLISAGYFTQDGTIIGSDYQRLTLRINTSSQIRKWLKIGENLSFSSSVGHNAMNNSSAPGASILSAALTMAPWDPVYYPKGTINNLYEDISGRPAASSNNLQGLNPMILVNKFHPEDKYERWVGNAYLEISPFKQLVFRSSYSFDLQTGRNMSFTEQFDLSAASEGRRSENSLSRSMTRWSTFGMENTLTYSNIWNKHNRTVMLGQTTEEYNMYGINAFGSEIINPIQSNWYINQTSGTNGKRDGSDAVDRTRMLSGLGRLFYSYADRYLITMNFRVDGSSKFPRHFRGYFPSTSLAWRISEESFMKNIKYLDNLKLRFGWGRIGNANTVGSSSFIKSMSSGVTFMGYVFGPSTTSPYYQTVNKEGAAILTIVNLDGTWETTETLNAGLDFGFKNGLINGTVDLFQRNTKDMALTVKAPAQIGNRFDPWDNVGVVRNTGIEITLSHHNKTHDFEYNIEGNVSLIKNRLIKLNGGSPVWSNNGLINSNLGLQLFSYWGYKYLGVYQTQDEVRDYLTGYASDWTQCPYQAGDAKFADISGPDGKPDGKIDSYDQTNLGSNFPWLTGGLNFTAAYKNIDFQMFLQGIYGNKIYNSVRIRTEGTGKGTQLSTAMRNAYIDFSDDHKNALVAAGLNLDDILNLNGTIPNPNNNVNSQNSSRFIESGAYLRLKNIEFGYTLPPEITKKAGIVRARLYVSASNLLTFTKYTGYDPEVGNNGEDNGNYPQSRTVMFGVNLDF